MIQRKERKKVIEFALEPDVKRIKHGKLVSSNTAFHNISVKS